MIILKFILIIWTVIFDLAYLAFFISIPFGVVHAIKEWRMERKCFDRFFQYKYLGGSCWGMKSCGEDDCCYRHMCPIYQNGITPKRVIELEKMLEERRKELEDAGEQNPFHPNSN